MMGQFVVFEGSEGIGKSTQAKALAERKGALYTCEPGGLEQSQAIRELVLGKGSQISEFAEALLFTIDRSIHIDQLVRPRLKAGQNVVCDRFVGSFLAYQGYGRGLDLDWLKDLCARATKEIKPDLVILMLGDLSETGQISGYRKEGEKDRIESENMEFHNQVRQGYKELLVENPDTWVEVDVSDSIEEVSSRIDAIVAERLNW